MCTVNTMIPWNWEDTLFTCPFKRATTKPEIPVRVGTNLKFSYHNVFLVSFLLDVLVCSLDVLDVHRTELA